MKSRTTVFLILALLACVAYAAIWRGGFFLPPSGQPLAKNTGPLLADRPGKLVELTVTSKAGGQMKFQASDDGWRIIEPIATAAIDDKITALVDTLITITCLQRYEPTSPGAPDATVTGLDSPRWTVTLTDDKQQTYGVKIGRHVPLSGKTRTYVRLAGDKRICVAQGDFTEAMSRPVSYYRRARVLEIAPDAIMALRVAGGETYGIHRQPLDKWIIKSGRDNKDQFLADKQAIETFLHRFARIDAREFIDDNPADLEPYGLAAGSERLAVTIAFMTQNATNAETRTITLGLKTGEPGREVVFAKLTNHPTVFTLPASMIEDLQPSTLKLRDKKVLPITADSVNKIEMTLGSESMTLVKTDKKWSLASPTTAPANQQRVQLILDRLATLMAMGFRAEKASEVQFGFERPRGVIRLFETVSGKPITLKIGSDSPAGAVAFVRSSSADVVAAVGASEVGVFLAPLVRYYDPALWSLPERTDVNRIVLTRPDGVTELAGSADGQWRLTKPLAAPVDAENVNSILDCLDNLTATRIVSVGEKTRAYYARGGGAISAAFELRAAGSPESRPADKTHTFNMTILDGKIYGWMTDDPLARVGLFTGKLYRQFATEVRRRKVLDFDPESITEITLTSGKTRMLLKKLDSGWKHPDDPELQIDQAAVTKYLDQIKNVRAIRFVFDINAPAEKFGLEKSNAWISLELTTKDKKTIVFSISRTGVNETVNRFASVSGLRGVFVISAETAAGLARKIGDFKKQIIP